MSSETILSNIKLTDAMRMYDIEMARGRRIPCPIHKGTKKNFSYNDKFYICWSCGAKGSVIDFVMDYFNMNVGHAMRKLECDFNLTDKKPTLQDMKYKQEFDEEMERLKELKRSHERYYRQMTDLYRQLFKLSQRQKIKGLEEYMDRVETWLDDNLEEFKAEFY